MIVHYLRLHGDYIKGAFIKLDENTFAQITLSGYDRTMLSIEIFPAEQMKGRLDYAYMDWDKPSKRREGEERVLGLKEFKTDTVKDRRQQLKEIINEYKSYDPKELTDEDLDIILALYLVDEKKDDGTKYREIGMVPREIRDIPEFKQKVINYAKDNPPHDRIWDLFSPSRNFLNESIFLDKEFMEKVPQKYHEDGSEAISHLVYYNMKEELKDPEFLEQKLQFIENLLKENNDPGILKGMINHVDKEKFKKAEFVDRILAITNDSGVLSYVLEHMDKEELKNPERMLKMINICPEILGVFKEKYDNGRYLENPYKELIDSEELKNGLLDLYGNMISRSEVEKHVIRGSFRSPKDKIYYRFEKGSPMAEFEDKMSYGTQKILTEIVIKHYEEQQRESENSQFTSYQLSEMGMKARGEGIAAAVALAERYNPNIRQPETLSPETLGKMAAENTRPGNVNEITADIREASISRGDRDQVTQEGHDKDEH